ncbi:DsrE family protein [Bradyrhizobium elkanii]|uniref:Intracellular sulfur oxidation DsrE/DsrF family protein n=1 Tax=Bradyrhizobium elkanii TaxID=29448 RepID=A0ABV4F8J5_BRAEL|nr:DsrE family protein [Bradyrhizobium elkanii]MBP2433339.1 intracellular sulfur oxidation DsrE/DsrF family protein [Bradyrhizobium elkanii]MCP1750856.1 intracellular sulfur oxidation DsrE/DsrF family protein [Bradyrhizobium elkanii]MCP1976630.1 intracellular sulfur oxidation DsrE/DsrF family protein [Bradyrhizobium elkanii]MCS3888851.1 intracellular sulfur oxidation DsrE/DsrF family protein [Bradyrhizobium elkanii]MCS4212127.1 intracellular sulfur oxidation DsrE/DsrF family protein [Bradyrhiz
MHRRSILWGTLSAIGAVLAASRADAATEAPPQKLKVVYHLDDLDKVNFVIGNIQNHLDGVGGPGNVTIALVVHGQALKAFHSAAANPDLSKHVARFTKDGIEFAACANTMKSQNIGLADLLPGFAAAERGGVVRLAELQSQGYLYLRP